MDEFGLIERLFAPLASGFPPALALKDDAAVMPLPPAGYELVLTCDAMSAGIHFLGNEAPSLIAKKLLRTNLSDLAAKGASPLCYLLSLALPSEISSTWIEDFVHGLREDQAHYDIQLAGGDTTRCQGAFTASITAIGTVPMGCALLRANAKAGDRIYVSGTLGDSALGLKLLQGTISAVSGADSLWLKERYFLPQPRLHLGHKLIGHAHACMDISDGLVQDLGHLCAASRTGAVIHRQRLPLSQAALSLLSEDERHWQHIYSGGDDYELLFTVPHSEAEHIESLAQELLLPLTCIGDVVTAPGVILFDEHGHNVTPVHGGYRHF